MSLPARSEERYAMRVVVSGQTIKLLGVLEEADVSAWFHPFLLGVHETAVRTKMPEVVLDIRQLSYANAGLWRAMLLWLRLLGEHEVAPYKLRLLSDPGYRWQKVGVPALQHFGKGALLVR